MLYADTVKAMLLERGRRSATLLGMSKRNPFRYFRTSPEIIRLAVLMYVRFPLSLRNVEDLLHERGIESGTKRCGSGGSALARCSQLRSASGESAGCAPRDGAGI